MKEQQLVEKTNSPSKAVITVPKNIDEVVCDGGHPTLGHPKTYYSFDGKDVVICGYCDRKFSRG
jgi:uncharacterized Zn-finger protein